MKKILLILLTLTFLNAKKDFYYGFINSSGTQISEKRKQAISDGFDIINHVKNQAKEGKINEAYDQILAFKLQNRVKVLDSDIMIAYAQLAIKKKFTRIALDATDELEHAINDSVIRDSDLPKAYMLLVELKLRVNKVNDAKYFALTIINNFDDPITKAYGKIYLAKVYKHTKSYKKATKVLYEILTKTTNILIATIVADELFDTYILNNEKEKAYNLVSKVLTKNIEYYANDSYLAIQKVNKLIKANMPEFAVEILQELLLKTTKDESIEDFKYKLANTYMLMYDKTDYYLFKAKELYKDVLNFYPKTMYARKIRMSIDEILMREGQIKPASLSKKYKNSQSMQQKILLQELLNDKENKKFAYILKAKKIYRTISTSITKRFGYESVETIFDEINILRIKELLAQNKCFDLNEALKKVRRKTLLLLVEDKEKKFDFFQCLTEVPNKRAYELIKDTFNSRRDAEVYLYLEKIAFSLGLYDEALGFSSKVDMVNNEDILSKEFLQRFLILSSKEDTVSMQKFFAYALKKQNYIEDNLKNPLIIDFYYQFYLYLLSKENNLFAYDILNKLYEKQKDFKARVYSPFVEIQLALNEKNKNNKEKSMDYLLEGLDIKRKIKDNDLAQMYYELINLYEDLGNNVKKDDYILKCKELKNTKDSLYKNMCDKL